MSIWTMAVKDMRLLIRDRRGLALLVALPLVFILALGLSLGSGYGQKPDERLRISIVDEDQGERHRLHRQASALLAPLAGLDASLVGGPLHSAGLFLAAGVPQFPYDQPRRTNSIQNSKLKTQDSENYRSWSQLVQDDLADTAGIRVEVVATREEAERLVESGERSAVIVFGPGFSEQVGKCSFLVDGINPFFRDGVLLDKLDAQVLRDETQRGAASIIEQVAQVSLLRVVLPYMIGKAFERLSDDEFIELMGRNVELPVPEEMAKIPLAITVLRRAKILEEGKEKIPLSKFTEGSQGHIYREAVGRGVQAALREQFKNYELTGKTWARLTRALSEPSAEPPSQSPASIRYQLLVPANTVMFAFFIVLTAGWVFVAERRQGTLERLRAAPLSSTDIFLGKLFPCLAFSIVQALFLLGAGRLVFGMDWGAAPWGLVPVVIATSFAASGLALLVAALARTETQVAAYGTLLVMVLAGISGCMMPRNLMPESMKELSRITPHAWALDAYNQLLLSPTPNLWLVAQACGVLLLFGAAFSTAAWWMLWRT